MKKIVNIVTFFVITILLSGCVSLNNQVSMKKARVIYDVPKTVDSEKVKESLLSAISSRTEDIKDIENLMPEELPEKPEHPIVNKNNIFAGLAPIANGNPEFEAMQLDTHNAWFSVQGKEEFKSIFNSNYVVYKGAIYPYKDGYKVYIYEFYREGTNGIVGHLAKKITKSVTKEETPLLLIAQISGKFKKKIPSAKLINAAPSKLKKIQLNWFNQGNFGLD
jgi:hypothetical protein